MWFVKYKKLSFFQKFHNCQFFVSTYVLQELLLHHKKFWLSQQELENKIISFLKKFNILAVNSTKIENSKFSSYVNDSKDTQILYDAILSESDILLTDNLKDFKIDEIQQKFNLRITNQI